MSPQSLYWLLIKLTVLVASSSITQYATFDDSGIPNPCHVGVLAKENDGTTWVIRNNGKLTYSMILDEYKHRWGWDTINISSWTDSANGTSVEGAVGAGSQVENCYDTRDAVVRYFSSGNGTLDLEPVQICPPARRYCGHDPEAEAIGVTIEDTQEYLIICGQDADVAQIRICELKCTSRPDRAGYSRCECDPDMHYCGNELGGLGGWDEYDNNTLYLCLDGMNVSTIQRCSIGCLGNGQNSACSGFCAPNQSYCGQQLLELGFAGYHPKGLYQCDDSGQSAHSTHCSQECVLGDSGGAFCRCQAGRTYCVYQLFAEFNWWWLKNDNAIRPHQTVLCLPENTRAMWLYFCTKCVASHGEQDAYCQWTPGPYCGRRLNEMGWTGYENDTMYQCGEESGNATIISTCLKGTCGENRCDCIPKQTYCGHQLYWMGWTQYDSEETQSMLRQCTDRSESRLVSRCSRCSHPGGQARCECTDTELYCGHELDADPPYEDNAIYRCNNERRASIFQACKGACMRMSEGSPGCLGECTPGQTYCGSKLLALGYSGYSNDNIFNCSTDGRTVRDSGRVDTLCTKCTPGRTYCGHQLRHKQHVAETDLHRRYVCKDDGSFDSTAVCTTCINHGAGAYCHCIPGWLHCGRLIYESGWKGFGETVPVPANFTNDTLFRCVHDNELELVEHCPKHECHSTEGGIAYCLCSPGRTYCGHQLDTHYNSLDTYLSPNRVYQCSDTKLWVDPFGECGTCVSINGNPVCRQQCIHRSRYCGSDLLGMEGWDSLDSNVLYQCTNGSFASAEQNCTQGCHAKNGEVDAYCLGMPTPWYWFLMATTLPLLFLILCLWLVRTIIKHRRLKKFVRQHRINASQLTLVRKLGHGQFGEVWQGIFNDINGQKMDVALKISKHNLNSNPGLNLASANCFFQESVALDFLRHENITRPLGICSNLKMAGGITTPALILEYMDGGNSADYVLSNREHLLPSDLIRIFTDICQAGEHLEKTGVIHRDIAARNVLIRKNPRNGKPQVAKLTDFGLAKDIGKSAGVYRSTNPDRAMFHEGYTAPEGFRGEFSSQSDVWSFGVFMWELYMLMDKRQTQSVAPYSDIPSQDILREIGNGYRLKRPLLAPTYLYSTMTSCWAWMPESRPTFRQLRKTLLSVRSADLADPQQGPPVSQERQVEPPIELQDTTGQGYVRPA